MMRSKGTAMQRIAERAARLFKLLAGLERDEPVGPYVFALYTCLVVVGMMLFAAWMTRTPMECAVRPTC